VSAPEDNNPWMGRAVFGVVCILIVGIYAWSAESGWLDLVSPRAEDSYYNLLVQGFRSGQLNLKREAPPGLSQLADPYDPAANAAYVWDTRYLSYETSYYKGKLYLYFGVTPALVLFWPYAALTGHYLPHKEAVVIFFSLGFLVSAGLLYAIWRRYFAEVSVWAAAAGILALGLATGTFESLAFCNVYEVAISCGFALAMLALAAIWFALHAPKRQTLWLALASLAYGLAIGSRPSLLFGGIILLVPVVRAWRGAIEPGVRPRVGLSFLAAVGPAMLIGLGLMLYNDLRFDNPFEFGWLYQLTAIQNTTASRHFSLNYLWFNLWLYLWEPYGWTSHFPFLQTGQSLPAPSHYYYGVGGYCGILCNYPIVWLALAAPLAWKARIVNGISVLRWFMGVAFLLFAVCGLTLCLFFTAGCSYLPDFLTALMLMAVIGILGLERTLADLPAWRFVARCFWSLLLSYSIAFNIFASFKTHAQSNYFAGASLLSQGRLDEAIEHFEKAVALDPSSAPNQVGLAKTYCRKGSLDEAIVHFKKALESEPGTVEILYALGCTLLQAGRVDEAVVHFQKASGIEPGFAEAHDPGENNNFAWSLATNPEASNRNGAIAIILAEGACRKTRYQITAMVGTLAAAYAEAGRFDDAISTAQKAITLARQNGESDLLQKNQELLVLYLKHQPYHENLTNSGK
jgi:tetratricopeptide (TPR) repeat protein